MIVGKFTTAVMKTLAVLANKLLVSAVPASYPHTTETSSRTTDRES